MKTYSGDLLTKLITLPLFNPLLLSLLLLYQKSLLVAVASLSKLATILVAAVGFQ